jgi:hypothetical protein
LEAVFTTATEAPDPEALALVTDPEPVLLLEELAHAESMTDAASAGTRNFINWRMLRSDLANRPMSPAAIS